MEPPAWREGVTDEAIVAQSNAILADVTAAQPLVGERAPVAALAAEYADNPSFAAKLGELGARFAAVRRMRGDGNCFYRAVLAGLGEALVRAGVRGGGGGGGGGAPAPAPASGAPSSAQRTYDALLAHAAGALDRLVAAGYPRDTTDDFVRAYRAWLDGLGAPGAGVDGAALAPLREPGDSFYIIYAPRLFAAAHMKEREGDFLPYVLGTSEHDTVAAYCAATVETAAADADALPMMALAADLGIALRVAYLDGAPGPLTFVNVPDAPPPGALTLDLLFRPGHYDVVYTTA